MSSSAPGRAALPTLHLIGAPCDAGASVRGASMGPEALRVAGLAEALVARGHPVVDRGNLQGPGLPFGSSARTADDGGVDAGYRHLQEVTQWSRLVFDAFDEVLTLNDAQATHLPLLLGGDHSLAIGSITAVARHCRRTGRDLRVLWLDAHADFNTPRLSPSGNLHGMPLACLSGMGPRPLTHLQRRPPVHHPALDPSCVRLIGIRSVDAGERRLVHDHGLQVYDMRHVDEAGMRATMAEALYGVDARTHLHVSLDVDFLDPSVAPGVATAVPGGPTYREAQLCMEMIADTGALASLDVVELNPACDERNRSAVLVVDLIESLFGKSTLLKI